MKIESFQSDEYQILVDENSQSAVFSVDGAAYCRFPMEPSVEPGVFSEYTVSDGVFSEYTMSDGGYAENVQRIGNIDAS